MSVHRERNVHQDMAEGFELGPEGRPAAEAHARACPECRDLLAAQDLLEAYLAGRCDEVSTTFVRRTCERAFAGGRPRAPLWWVALPPSWRLGLAALLVLAALGGLAFPGRQELTACHEPTVVSVLDTPEIVAMRAEAAPAPQGD